MVTSADASNRASTSLTITCSKADLRRLRALLTYSSANEDSWTKVSQVIISLYSCHNEYVSTAIIGSVSDEDRRSVAHPIDYFLDTANPPFNYDPVSNYRPRSRSELGGLQRKYKEQGFM
jgi:hypothetical protein